MRRRRLALYGMVGSLWLVAAACGEVSGGFRIAPRAAAGGECGTVYLEGVEEAFSLVADLSTPGSSPSIALDAFVPGSFGNQILLTRTLVLTLPATFSFQGFDAPGGPAPSATWDFDFSNPGNGTFDPVGSPSDYRIPIVAISADQAWADSLLNGSYDAGVDPLATHTLGSGGVHVFTIELPSGGTNNNGVAPDAPCSYFTTDTPFTLAAGIVGLPASSGSYDVQVDATSVDPDTGDLDDAQGVAPSVYQQSFTIAVPEPGPAAAGATVLAALGALGPSGRARRR